MCPLVSVIMPVKNSERFLGEALDSLARQTWRDYEVVVVDGASADGTEALVRGRAGAFPSPPRFLQQEGPGLGGARNTGLAAARGELVAFLDHDDRWDERKLELQVKRMLAEPALRFTLGWVRFFREPGTDLRPGYRPESFTEGQAGWTPGALVARHTLFDAVGGFDPALAIGCDSEWFARVKDRQVPWALVPEALLLKRIHDHNLSAGVDRYRREMLHLLRRSVHRKRAAGKPPAPGDGGGPP